MAETIRSGRAVGVLVKGIVYVLKRSSSRYGLVLNGGRGQFCCQDGCCDRGLQPDVAHIVEQAKALGATKVVIRTGQRNFYVGTIAGLPVEDVTRHVGHIDEGIFIDSAY